MKIAIIITTPDYAGTNIKNNLVNNFKISNKKKFGYEIYLFKDSLKNKLHEIEMYTTDQRCVFLENIDKEIDADLFIIPTTHRSSANTHSLSCHTQGNWADADLGGIPKNISYCPALFLKDFFIKLYSFKIDSLKKSGKNRIDEEITMECTHHGPQIEKPTIFIEIGSDENQWKRPELGKIIADTIMEVLSKPIKEYKTAIGLGGPHYCNNFNKLQLKQEADSYAIGHICPKYALDKIDKEMIMQAIDKTVPRPEIAILDWKGLGANKQKIVSILEEIGINYIKI